MAQHRKFDRRLLAQLPKNRRVEVHGFKRSWWYFGKKKTGVAIATVVSPMEWNVTHEGKGENPPPIDVRELLDHVRSLATDSRVPYVIGVCSPTGFTPEARQCGAELRNVTLVLIEPAPQGGWRIAGGSSDLDSRLRELFDPEDLRGKTDRVRQYLQEHSADLLTGSITADRVAEALSIPEPIVRVAYETLSFQNPELQVHTDGDDLLIYRGAATFSEEKPSMSMIEKIRQLFSREGNEAKKINELSRRRAALAQRRDRLYDDIGQMEKREADLLDQGKTNKSQVVRRRIAAQMAQLRKDIARQNATTNMLNKQIDILSTNIHNLTLVQQGQIADLPTTEELTETAVAAEEMLETLKADADMVHSLDTGISDVLTSDEELAILKEFDEPEASSTTPTKAEPSKTPPVTERTNAQQPTEKSKRKEPEAS